MSLRINCKKKKTSRMGIGCSSNQAGLCLTTKHSIGKEEKRKIANKKMMKITNKIIANKVVFRTSIFQKAFGLMFHKKIYDEAHIFIFDKEQKVALTMWFVFFPIDVIYLDSNKRIVEIVENFKPWHNYYPKKESKYVIELPFGTIKKYEIKNKDLVQFRI